MKVCSNCGGPGPFGHRKGVKDELKSQCKTCCAQKQIAYAAQHPETWVKWAAANSERLEAREIIRYAADPEGQKAKVRAYQAKNPAKVKLWTERGNLKKYGLTPEDKQALFEKQAGKCSICFCPLVTGRTGMHIDHDHETGVVRGLLCHLCNVMLGAFAEDPARLVFAVAYLRRGLVVLTPRSRPREAAKPGSRAMNLWYKYGLTEEAVIELRALQGGGCGICQAPLGTGQQAHIDHDHGRGRKAVRGLLCRSCNLGLGHARETLEILRKAVKYLT